MGAPYKMKYTNGKKADPAAFPFNESLRKAAVEGKLNPEFEKAVTSAPDKMMGAQVQANPQVQDMMKKKVDEVVQKKVDDSLQSETNI